MYERISEVLAVRRVSGGAGDVLGRSRQGHPVRAFRFGKGTIRVSLLAGCHADEPVGPRLLGQLVTYLASLPKDDDLLTRHQWWIVPHINPDGEQRNRAWYEDDADRYDIARYLAHVVREPPGDDIEFGFPHSLMDDGARPENRAVHAWWHTADGPFALHLSLHGMGFAAGPWFLIDPAWKNRCGSLMARCTSRVREMGYALHDVERDGEKGFERIARGFCTRPNSVAMRAFFLAQEDAATAELFRPSSMETIRSLGGDPLTLVSEMPLFITPGVGDTLGPPDPIGLEWKERHTAWQTRLGRGEDPGVIRDEADAAGLAAMVVRDQMELQWTFIVAGLEQVHALRGDHPSDGAGHEQHQPERAHDDRTGR